MVLDMTPEAAVFQFLSGFSVPAYTATSVPDRNAFPYITYELPVTGGWGYGEANIRANVWYRTDSEAVPNAKVREIGDTLGIGGITIPCDGGMLWLRKGNPWSQPVEDESDSKVKRRYVNISIEYMTL